MKCPLLKGEIDIQDATVTMDHMDYLKEECAWWVPGEECCSVLVLAALAAGIVVALDDVTKKTPHGEQFRR